MVVIVEPLKVANYSYGLKWQSLLMMPEFDVMLGTQQNANTTVLMYLLTLSGMITVSVAIANWVTARIGWLNRSSQELAAGDLTQKRFQHQVEVEATRRSEACFQQLAAAIPGMIYTYTQHTDGSHGFDYVSSASRSILELEPEQIIADVNAVLDQIHPDDRPTHDATVAHSAETLEPFTCAFRNLTPSGQLKWLEASSRPLRQDDGSITWYGILLDVSDRKAVEVSLAEKTAFLDEAQRTAKMGSWSWTLETDERWWSPQMYQLLGIDPEQYPIPPDVDIANRSIHPEDRERVNQVTRAAIEQGNSYEIEFRLLRPDNSIGYVFSRGLVERNAEGQVTRFWGVSQDITDRKDAETALRHSQAALAEAQRIAHLGNWEFHLPSRKLVWSEELFRMFGLDPSQPEPSYADYLQCYIHPDDRARLKQCIKQSIITQKGYIVNYRALLPDGSTRYHEGRGDVESDAQGQVIRLFGTALDITDRRQTELALRQSEKKFRGAFDTITTGMALITLAGGFQEVNAALCQMLGYSEEELLEHRLEDIVHPLEQIIDLPLFELMMAGKIPGYQVEKQFLRQDGHSLWGLFNIALIPDGTGCPLYLIAQITDISDRKQTEQELEQAKESAEAANQAKSQFLANMSHELRTPLNSILGFSELMRGSLELSREYRDYLNLIYKSGESLLKLINEILDLSKIEAGKLTLDNQAIDLFDQLHLISNTLSARVSSKNLQFLLEIQPDVPQYIAVDAQKLEQVLLNLLSNAIKFTETGGVTLRVRLGETKNQLAPDGAPLSHLSCLIFEVEDTGVGIAPSDLSLIFDPFAQTSVGQQAQEGTGLGLTISRRLVQLMGGEITVQSVLGQGTLFQFMLPVETVSEARIQPSPCNGSIIGLASDQALCRILVVDDQPENRLLLVRMFEQLGFPVQEAATGEDAIACWRQWHPHIIWMDICLPGLDGYETTRRIRAEEQERKTAGDTASCPTIIIALTAQALPGDRVLAFAAGCNDYISKPFRQEALFSKMEEHLRVCFLYSQDEFRESDNQLKPTDLLKAEDLTDMPKEWVMELYQASVYCDDNKVQSLLQQIPPEYAFLIDGLNQLVHNFDFKQIMDLANPVEFQDK